MKPPYTITSEILSLVSKISQKVGEISTLYLVKQPVELRKKNRIKTIQSSLEIEGNTLSIEQVTAILENKRVLAPQKDILEVQNAINVYNQLGNLNFYDIEDFKKAHRILMDGLIEKAGQFRTSSVGIIKGSKVEHIAPKGEMVYGLMVDLFDYLKNDPELLLIKSCVFHYELEFIHPFSDGNGRMGRLWQTLILMQYHPIFEFLPIEFLIKNKQQTYYDKLAESDKKGESTPFVEFMLEIILEALNELSLNQSFTLHAQDRILLFKEKTGEKKFSRKDYMLFFKNISAPTASRDLRWAVENQLLVKTGNYRLTLYQFK